jgi:hypothetical protein
MRRLITTVLFAASLAGSAAAADYGSGPTTYGHPWHALPSCDAPGIAARISEKFSYQDRHIVHSGVAITGIERMRETGAPGWASRIERRHCSATAWLSNGRKAEVVYLIEGPHLGALTVGWHLESCVTGHDPYHVYDAQCRSIRP